MTRKEMYELLREKSAQTDWSNLASIKSYNSYARMLRELVEESKEETP